MKHVEGYARCRHIADAGLTPPVINSKTKFMNSSGLSMIPTIFMYVVIGGMFALVLLNAYWRGIDRKYGCSRSGGRDGFITVQLNGRMAMVEFELAGKEVDMIIYDKHMKWIGANSCDLSETDRTALSEKLKAWCKARKYTVELESMRVT
jgi:hypothetical protein